MAGNIKIMQGDSYPIPFELTQAGYALTPEMVKDVRLTVGEVLSYSLSAGKVFFNYSDQKWYFRPSQAETLNLDVERYQVMAKVKYRNTPADVISVPCGMLDVLDATDTEEI